MAGARPVMLVTGAVVPAQAGTHNHGSCNRRSAGGYGPPPSRGRPSSASPSSHHRPTSLIHSEGGQEVGGEHGGDADGRDLLQARPRRHGIHLEHGWPAVGPMQDIETAQMAARR